MNTTWEKETDEEAQKKCGVKIFTGEYRSCVVAILNEDGTYDVLFSGEPRLCAGLLRAAQDGLDKSNMH